MSDEVQQPPLIYEGLDPLSEPRSAVAEASEVPLIVNSASLKPGMG
jgi:hypothetical protein